VRCVLARGRVVHRRTTTPGLMAIRAARVLTGEKILTDVVIVCRDGKILEIGPDVHLPTDAERHEFHGTVVPGFVDGWSGFGLSSGNLSMPAATMAKADDAALGRLRARGVTSLVLVPRGTGLVSGMASVVSTGLDDGLFRVLRRDAALTVNVGTTGDRASHALKLRDLMDSVTRYDASWKAYLKAKKKAEEAGEKFAKKAPRSSRSLEPWRKIASGDLALLARADRVEDVRIALTVLYDGFEDRYPYFAILGGGETYRVLDEVVEAKVPVVLAGWPRVTAPDFGRVHLGRRLARAGVPLVVGSGGGSFSPLDRLSEAIRSGISLRTALAAVTTVPARTFGVANVCGRIRPGYGADLVHLSADPGAPGCHVRQVLVGGMLVHEREDER